MLGFIIYLLNVITVSIIPNAATEDAKKNVITPCNVVDLFFIFIFIF